MSAGVVAGTAKVLIGADLNPLQKALGNLPNMLKQAGAQISSIGTQLGLAGAAIATPLGIAARTFASFQDQMAIVGAVTRTAGSEFAALSEEAKKLGETTSFTAQQVAEGMTNLGRAGFTSGEILSTIGPSLNIARAGAVDLGTATQVVSDTLRSFGLSANQAVAIGDQLVYTVNGSANSMVDLSEAMKYAGSTARLANVDTSTINSALAILGNNAIRGSMAGTSLSQSITKMVSGDGLKRLTELNVKITNADGGFRDLIDIVEDVTKATDKMGEAEKLATFFDIFDARAYRAIATLSQNVDGWRKFRDEVNQSGGTAATVAKRMDDTLGGSFRMLMSAVEGVQIAIGEQLTPLLREWMSELTTMAGQTAAWVKENRSVIETIAKVAASLLGAGVALKGIGFAVTVFGSLAQAATTAAGAMKAFSIWLNISTVNGYAAALKGLVTSLQNVIATSTGVTALRTAFIAAGGGFKGFVAVMMGGSAAILAALAPIAIALGVITAAALAYIAIREYLSLRDTRNETEQLTKATTDLQARLQALYEVDPPSTKKSLDDMKAYVSALRARGLTEAQVRQELEKRAAAEERLALRPQAKNKQGDVVVTSDGGVSQARREEAAKNAQALRSILKGEVEGYRISDAAIIASAQEAAAKRAALTKEVAEKILGYETELANQLRDLQIRRSEEVESERLRNLAENSDEAVKIVEEQYLEAQRAADAAAQQARQAFENAQADPSELLVKEAEFRKQMAIDAENNVDRLKQLTLEIYQIRARKENEEARKRLQTIQDEADERASIRDMIEERQKRVAEIQQKMTGDASNLGAVVGTFSGDLASRVGFGDTVQKQQLDEQRKSRIELEKLNKEIKELQGGLT